MSRTSKPEITCCRIPYMYGVIFITSRGDPLTIRRPRDCIDLSRMTSISVEMASRCGLPYAYCLICTCRGDQLAIRRPSNCIHFIAMVERDKDKTSILRIPDVEPTIVVSRGNEISA